MNKNQKGIQNNKTTDLSRHIDSEQFFIHKYIFRDLIAIKKKAVDTLDIYFRTGFNLGHISRFGKLVFTLKFLSNPLLMYEIKYYFFLS